MPKSRKTSRLQRPKTPNNKSLRFTQREIQRCIKAARAMKISIGAVEVDPQSGKISIISGTPTAKPRNEWDDETKTEVR